MSRLLTAEQLRLLAAGPEEQLAAALEEHGAHGAGADGPVADGPVADLFFRLEQAFRDVVGGFGVWASLAQRWLAEHTERPGSAGGLPVDRAWLVAGLHGVAIDDIRCLTPDPPPIPDGPVTADGILSLFRRRRDSFRRLHDASLDWTCALWSEIYRVGGPDGLEDYLRAIGDKTLLRWMAQDVVEDPVDRITRWASLLNANFASITLDEDDDHFTIVQDPCGTCSRQVRYGAYGPPLDLAVVGERHLVTYGQGDLPVYRCHVAVIHHAMGIERTGHPWPVHDCPAHLGTGPCTIRLRKAPHQLQESAAGG
ncbi:MAG TPA: hypothetical protein VHX40_09040 [Acidimicrobiales bacterium]|nr:hypothetical protein [Acidimicrobiales bacterium]